MFFTHGQGEITSTDEGILLLIFTGSYSEAQASLKSTWIPPTQPPECRDYRHQPPPYIFFFFKSLHFVEWDGNVVQISSDTVVSWPVAVLHTAELDKRTQAQAAPSSPRV